MKFKYILTTCFIFTCFFTKLFAQGYIDGNMQVIINFREAYNETGDDIWPDPDEFNLIIQQRDYPDIDGSSWFSTGTMPYDNTIGSTGPFILDVPDFSHTYTYGATRTTGPFSAPNGVQMGFTSWEDDCPGSCVGFCGFFGSCSPSGSRTNYDPSCSGGCVTCPCFAGGDDQFCSGTDGATSSYNFRAFPPNAFSPSLLRYTGSFGISGSCGDNDNGATFQSFWTPPCPDTLWADRPVICDPGYVTLRTGGAVFGGSYRWYVMSGTTEVFFQETLDSFISVFVNSPTTYRVYTKNGGSGAGFESWSHRQITIFQDNININSISTLNPLCADSLNGRIVINASSTLGLPLQYSIDAGTTWQVSNTFNGLGDGIYLVKVKTAFCTAPSIGVPVQLIDPAVLAVYVGRIDSVRCNGNADGAIELSVTGGTGPYSFSWSNGSTTEDIVSLSPNTYTVTVTDNHGCLNTLASATVYEPIPLSATTLVDSVSCAGSADGSASITVSGGNGSYSYLWNNGATTSSITSLAGGIYTVTVSDRKGCTLARALNVYEAPALNVALSKTDVLCYGGSDGTVSVDTNSIGGVSPFTYTWSPPAPNASTITGLTIGTYTVTVTDSRGCTTIGSITVNQPDSLNISSLLFDVRCNGGANGRIDITVSGGATPYLYSWTGGITSSAEDISGLSGGTYNLLVTDNHACTKTQTYIINEPAALATTFTNTNARCYGDNTASSTVNITGGTTPYNILWNTFATTNTISGVTAGTYTVIITDDNGCIHSNTTTITQPIQMELTNIGLQDNRCNGLDSGRVFFSVLGGAGTLDYAWSTGLPYTNNHPNLPAGIHTVVITDDSGCVLTQSFEIHEPTAFITNINGNSPTCADNSTGFAVVTALGSTPPYNYTWSTSPVQTGIMATNLGAGLYIVTITDLNFCTITDSITITAPLPISVTTVPLSVKCFGGGDGRVTVSASGGVGPYKYILNGILQTDSVFTGLTAGNYIIVVQDVNACVGNTTFSIAQPSNYAMNPTATPAVIQRGMTTQLNANIVSPLPIISVAWNAYPAGDPLNFSACSNPSNCQTPTASPIINTTYEIISTDSNSCVLVDSINVVVLQERAVFIPTAFSPNGDGKNETFDFQILGAESVNVSIWNRWGEVVYTNTSQINGAGQGWDGTNAGQHVPLDTYVYQFEVKYYDGTKETLSGTVNVLK
ncbi:MAG: gliding motility-associated C-terminal domain-containing protein [Bacteroidota bacterium]